MRVSVFFGRLLFALSLLSQGLAAEHSGVNRLAANGSELQKRSDATHTGKASIPSATIESLSPAHPKGSIQSIPQTRGPGVPAREPFPLQRHHGSHRKQNLVLKRQHRQLKRQCKSSSDSDSAAIGRAKTSGGTRRLNVLGYQL